jgi:pyruvate kinase
MDVENTPQSEWHADRLKQLIVELSDLRNEMIALENRLAHKTLALPAEHQHSAKNLIHYLALRKHDIRPLQDKLACFGLSSLGRSEARVLSNLDAVLKVICCLTGCQFPKPDFTESDFAAGRSILDQNTVALLGPKVTGRDVRIMVTMPSEAAHDYSLIRDLVAGGMDCMRINCAHDQEEAWARMVENLRRAKAELGKPCYVLMDVPGPKLRTGPTQRLPGVIKWSPRRDRLGNVTTAATIWLASIEHPEPPPEKTNAVLSVPSEWLGRLSDGDKIKFLDTRGLSRSMTVSNVVGRSRLATSTQTAYVNSDTILHVIGRHRTKAGPESIARISDLATVPQPIVLKPGDTLILTRSLDPGRPAVENERGEIVEPARIGVTLPEIFSDVRPGEKIWFDDGKIGGIITAVGEHEISVKIVKARSKGEKLQEDKGINLPDSRLRLPALTQEDTALLPFIASHSDLVGYSFVRDPADVYLLQEELAKIGGERLGIILKIETRQGFEKLPDLILASMRSQRLGVMIARGDLAVECGYERTGELQEEIMWIAEAAHVPVIWATQVLENLAKKGQASRAEITDAAMAERAECVMLNKGPYIVEAVRVLDDVLRRMQHHQAKKSSLLRPLTLADRFCRQHAS